MQPGTRGSWSRLLLWGVTAGVVSSPVPALADGVHAEPGVYAAVAGPLRSVQDAEWIAQATDEDMKPRAVRAEEPPRSVPLSEMISDLMTTARRRQERVQSTPVAVSNFSSDQLAAREERRLSDLDGLVPNLAVDNAVGSSNAVRISLRGVTAGEPTAASDQAVGVFVDGIYYPRLQGNLGALYDIDRIEVIRGPQGTLFGKNTIGGAINILTKPPTFEPEAFGEVRIGNFNQADTRATVNLPLVAETAALRVSLATNHDDGYQRNVTTRERFGNDRFLGGRARLLLMLAENVELMLTGEYTRQDRRPQLAKCRRVGPPNPSLQGIQNAIDFQGVCEQDRARSEFKSASDLTFAEDDLRTAAYSASVMWDVGNGVTLRSLSSFRDQNLDTSQDLDASPQTLAQSLREGGGSDLRAYSQEFQLMGQAVDARLSYLLGLYAFGENNDERLIAGVFAAVPGLDAVIPAFDARTDIDNRSLAAYGQLSFAVTPALSVTAGLRRTVERKRIHKVDTAISTTVAGPIGTVLLDFERSERFDRFTPDLAVSYQITPKALVYANYARGFRSGGFNGRADSTNSDTITLSPEDLTSYEVGLKTTFLDDRLLLNGAVFYSIYEDILRAIPTVVGAANTPAIIARNAAEARLAGAELELVMRPFEGLQLESALSAFRGRYTEFDVDSAPGTFAPGLETIDDASLVGQPDYLRTFAAAYELPPASFGALSARIQWTHRGPQANDVSDSRAVRSSKYGLLDARLTLRLPDRRTEVGVFGTNLLDRRYINNGIDFSDSVGLATPFFGPPRRYGVEILRQF